MSDHRFRPLFTAIGGLLLLWLGGNYILPLLLPFLLGFLMALAAEPAVRFLCRKVPVNRGFCAFLGVTATLLFLSVFVTLLVSLLVRELGRLAGILPDLEQTAQQGLTALEDWLLGMTMAAPEGIRPLLTRSVLGLFDSGSQLYDQALTQLPALATGVISHIPDGFLFFGTGLLSAYLISARMPQLQALLHRLLPNNWLDRWLPTLKQLKHSLWGWLRTQLKLAAMTFALVCAGLLLLRISFAPVWAFLIALVDAVPMLGTGLILIPWSLICFLQGNTIRGLGMLGLFVTATLLRSMLEPRLLGRQLGLDPLVTLVALYLGYQLFGFIGLLFSPLLAVAVMQLATPSAS